MHEPSVLVVIPFAAAWICVGVAGSPARAGLVSESP
jgi:hypothetical protein